MRIRILILITYASLFATIVLAHGGEVHVIGAAAKVAQDSITVKTTENKMVTVAVASETKFIKAKQDARIADLHVGDRLVIHAKRSTDGSLVADIVEFAGATPQQSRSETLTGIVSDSVCGATHTMKNMSAAHCARSCAKGGNYALVVGKSVYILHGHESDLERFAAEKVTVKGTVDGKIVTVESVALAR